MNSWGYYNCHGATVGLMLVLLTSISLCQFSFGDESNLAHEKGVGHQTLSLKELPPWIPVDAQKGIKQAIEFHITKENVFVSRGQDAIIEAYGADRTIRFLLLPKAWTHFQLERTSTEKLEAKGFPMKAIRSLLQLASFAPTRIILFGESGQTGQGSFMSTKDETTK